MSVNLSFIGGAGWQFFDNNGVPLNGGKIYTYAAGSTTPLTTYTSRSGLIPNTNPVVLDAAGRTPEQIWSTEGLLYKYVVTDANNVPIRTWDNIGGSVVASDLAQNLSNTTDNSKGDALVGFRQADANGFINGAVARTVSVKFEETVSVKDFGAVGNGVQDDTAALRAAFTYSYQSGKRLWFPRGNYIYSGPSFSAFYNYNTPLIWEGEEATITFTTLDAQFLVIYQPTTCIVRGINFVGPKTVGPSPSESHGGFMLYGCNKGEISNCSFTGFIGDGLLISGLFNSDVDQRPLASKNLAIHSNFFDENGRGGLTIISGDAISVYSNTFGPNTIPTAPVIFPGLHIEADTASRYPIGTLDVFNNTIYSYVTIINPLQINPLGDGNSQITIRDNLIKVSTQIAFSGPGCGNVAIVNNTIQSTFSGVPDTNVGLFWLKGGNITIENNSITAVNAQHIFNMTYWKTLGKDFQRLKISGNRVSYTAIAGFNSTLRIFGDNGTYSNDTWNYVDVSGDFNVPSNVTFISLNPGSSLVKINFADIVFATPSINFFMALGSNIPAGSQITVNNVSCTPTVAFSVPNFVSGAIRVRNSRITGTIIGTGAGITGFGSTVIPSVLTVATTTDGAGTPATSGNSNLPGFYDGNLTRLSTGVYEVVGFTVGLAATLQGSASITTNTNANFYLQFSRAGQPFTGNLRLLSYSGASLTDLPANAAISMVFDARATGT